MNEIEIKQQEIINLQASLSATTSDIGDWKVIKCYEAALQKIEPPYDIDELMTKRQAVRDKINKLQDELSSLTE